MFTEAYVVKAFNTFSAYSLDFQARARARQSICVEIINPPKIQSAILPATWVLTSLTMGTTSAKELENMPLYPLKEWQGAFKVTAVMFTIWLVYGMARYLFIKKDPYAPERAPSNITNKAFAWTALTLLAFCYLPGCLAGFLQTINGTKHKRFETGSMTG